MTKTPKISVIVPCFNHGEFLPEAIASVLATRRDDVEIIVVDDGSTDERTREETEAIAAQGIKVIRKQNGGPASARNAGIAIAHGEYILPLDADNLIRPSYIDRGIQILDQRREVGIVYGDAEFTGLRTGRWTIGPFDPNRLLQWNYIDACAVFRREVWEQVGGYDEARVLWGLEDWDFWLGAITHGWQFTYVPEVLYEYRVADGSMIKRAQSYHEETVKFIGTKYGPLYRKEFMQLLAERELERNSGRGSLRNLSRVIKSRLKQRFHLNGNQRHSA